MTVKAPLLVQTLSRSCSRHRLPHAPRRIHQAVARRPPSRPASLSNDDPLRALYEDLMTVDSEATRSPLPGANVQNLLRRQQDLEPLDIDSPALDNTTSQTAALEPCRKTMGSLLAEHARQGNIRDFELLLSRMQPTSSTEHQRDLHVKAHIVNASLSTSFSSLSSTQHFPTGALAVLHHYEASNHFAPIKSYTRVISALFNVQTCTSSDPGLGRAAAHAQAWDLFAHMRYVAHPVPDAHLYALMIRACGSFFRPEPERALDLWTEMQENGIKPTKGAYEAVIRVCGRAGPEWLGEGMRLAREMNDQYPTTDVNGKGLWCALLEGCKRAGDLKKARWILADAVRGSGDGTSSKGWTMDAELMTHILHTYASYKPPFRRETTRLIHCSAEPNGEVSTNEYQTEEVSSRDDSLSHMSTEETQADDVSPDIAMENVESTPAFSRLPPQTPYDVVAEARALFNRILQDRSASLGEAHHSPQDGLLVGRFAHVELTPALLNAYLSVFYRHAGIETSQETFDSLFGNSSAQVFLPDEYTYVNALERCAIARAEDRHIAARWAKDIWRRWEVIEAKGVRDGRKNVGSFARLVEKAHTAMRRVLVLSGDIDDALTLLRSFVSRYPPNAVLQSTDLRLASVDTSPIVMPIKLPLKSTTVQLFSKPPILSTRVALTNPTNSLSSTARPLVRLTSVVTPKDDRIPPVVGFSDVDLLHARLAEHGRVKDLGYIKWVCVAYANALKKRREAVLKAAPTRQEVEVD